jgi:acetyl esterase/lipase
MAFDNLPDLGPAFTPEGEAYSVWALEKSQAAAASLRVEFDIPYGDDPFQKLDLWLPANASLRDLPVVVYIHGGGWVRGYKEWNGFMAQRLSAIPAILVSPNHRLSTTAKYPRPLDDVLAALAWVYRNIEKYHGSKHRIFIGGHSSGGHLAALAALRTDLLPTHGLPADVVKACFPLSAPLDLRLERCVPGGRREKLVRAFLERDNQDREASAIEHTARATVPMLLAWGSEDIDEVREHNELMAERMRATKNCVFEYMVIPGATHTGTHRVFLDKNNPYVETMCAWIAKVPESARA